MNARTVAVCVLGATIGGALAPLALGTFIGTSLSTRATLALLLAGIPLSLLITWFATRRFSPLSLHFDRLSGFFTESLWAGMAACVAAALLGVCFLALESNSEPSRLVDFVIWITIVAAVAYGVRAGSMWGSVVVFSSASSGPIRTLVTILSAVSLGLGGAAVALYLASPKLAAGGSAPALHMGLATLVPAMCGLGAAMSYAETRAVASIKAHWQYLVLIAVMAVVPIIYLTTWRVMYPPALPLSAEFTLPPPVASAPTKIDINISTLPYKVKFDAEAKMGMKVALRYGEETTVDYVLSLWRINASSSSMKQALEGRRRIKEWDDPEIGCPTIELGKYELVVEDFDRQVGTRKRYVELDEIVPSLVRAFVDQRQSQSNTAVKLEVTLGSTDTVPARDDKECKSETDSRRLGTDSDRSTWETSGRLEIAKGVLEAGAHVEVMKPVNLREGPTWVAGMDVWIGKPMTVRSFQDATPPQFRVRENNYVWDSRWVVSLAPP